jgi:hypothetical protein
LEAIESSLLSVLGEIGPNCFTDQRREAAVLRYGELLKRIQILGLKIH